MELVIRFSAHHCEHTTAIFFFALGSLWVSHFKALFKEAAIEPKDIAANMNAEICRKHSPPSKAPPLTPPGATVPELTQQVFDPKNMMAASDFRNGRRIS
ncbi:unnamed protein product [Zymoseptoria tritici ST99CH_1E4]|uniref:Uncharacterized protein n=1 Tax=Zymoseptoria tritici ST99CH_1E4 TaxID=1276532 RepID=A0A2H1H9S7_ZYMTR|nr:unnamed protein product [Zymoseptoria tritici ST99CH_1E4]